jgi:hypothetical protein
VKSMVQTWSGRTGSFRGTRAAAVGILRRPRFRRSPSFSSTYSRYTRLWFTAKPSRFSRILSRR